MTGRYGGLLQGGIQLGSIPQVENQGGNTTYSTGRPEDRLDEESKESTARIVQIRNAYLQRLPVLLSSSDGLDTAQNQLVL